MKEKAEFKTGPTGVEFVDKHKAVSRNNTVLPAMVNADITDKDKAENQVSSIRDH